jgi:hypothetical protein
VTTEEVIQRINSDPEFVNLKRFEYSLAQVMERFPEGAPDRTIAQALMIAEDDVSRLYNEIIERLRVQLKIEL